MNRMGQDALMDLACAVAAGKGKSWCSSPHRLALRWRARLERALLWNVASNSIKSWGRVLGEDNPGDDWRKARGIPTGGANPTRSAPATNHVTAATSGTGGTGGYGSTGSNAHVPARVPGAEARRKPRAAREENAARKRTFEEECPASLRAAGEEDRPRAKSAARGCPPRP